MSAPTDRSNDPNSVSFYAPRGARPTRLAQPHDPVPALLPEDLDENRNPLLATNDQFEGDLAVQRLRLRRSLDPEYAPAPPLPLRQKSGLAVVSRLVMVIVAAAAVALIAIGQFPIPSFLQQQSSDRTADSSPPSRPSNTVRRVEAEMPRLLVRGARGTAGQPAPLGVSLQGRAEGAIVLITGLSAGMTLSAGSALGADGWQVPATDAVLGNTWIIPPKDFTGSVDLVAELHLSDSTIANRRPLHLEWVASLPPAAAAAPAVAAPTTVMATPTPAAVPPTPATPAVTSTPPATTPVAPPPRQAVPTPRQLDRDEIAVLVRRGKDFLVSGDVAAARLVLQRAAESKDAEAALTLAATYDPVVLRELKVYGVAADVPLARSWYEKATELGSTEASRRLEILASSGAR